MIRYTKFVASQKGLKWYSKIFADLDIYNHHCRRQVKLKRWIISSQCCSQSLTKLIMGLFNRLYKISFSGKFLVQVYFSNCIEFVMDMPNDQSMTFHALVTRFNNWEKAGNTRWTIYQVYMWQKSCALQDQ